MTIQDVHVCNHPVRGKPYDRLRYVRRSRQGVHLYRVEGDGNENPRRADNALRIAAERFGATCFFCLRPVTRAEMTIEHVLPKKASRLDSLFNLVVACKSCNSRKDSRSISDFDLPRTQIYLDALTKHLDELVRLVDLEDDHSTQSSPMSR